MSTRDEITQYASRQPAVLESPAGHPGLIKVYLGQTGAHQGHLIHIEQAHTTARLMQPTGQGEWLAQTLAPTQIAPGMTVRHEPVHATFPAPSGQHLALGAAPFSSKEADHEVIPYELIRPAFHELSGRRAPLATGIEAIDLLSPLSLGGVHLILDQSGERGCFRELVSRAHEALVHRLQGPEDALQEFTLQADGEPDARPPGGHLVTHARGSIDQAYTALRALLGWSQRERIERAPTHQLVTVTLPFIDEARQAAGYVHLPSMSDDPHQRHTLANVLSFVGDHLASTRQTTITTLITLEIDSRTARQFSSIFDTLSFGDLDAVLLFDEQGKFSPRFSRSRAELAQSESRRATQVRSALHRSELAQKKARVFGEDELTEEEFEVLGVLDMWSPRLKP